jgi:4'-phosphopantetheinyl transferase
MLREATLSRLWCLHLEPGNMSLSTNNARDIAHADFRVESPVRIAPDEVHLWRVDLEAIAGNEAHWTAIISDDERARGARFHFPIHRQYFIAGRAVLRRILAAYLSTDPKELTFSYSTKSKPALAGAHANRISFNVSHSGEIALIAVTQNHQIGVDVELIRRDFDTAAIATRFFSEAEQEQLAALPSERRHETFFLCWTRKEAYIKATGEGLSLPLRQFDVSIAPHSQNALLATRPDAAESKRWSLRDVAVKAEYVGAVCVSGNDWKLVDWSS